MATHRTVLVTGATGYIGGRLVPRLLEAGFRVRCLVRDPARLQGRPWLGQAEVAAGDCLRADTLPIALQGVEVACYLVHSMGVKFARAFGPEVVVFTTSPSKKDDAIRLGAHEVVISRNPDEMNKHTGSFDFILDAVAAAHDLNAYLNLLKVDGNLTIVGAPEKPHAVSAFALLLGRRSLSGSPIGGIAETQEMLDFCGKNNITADVEVIPIQKVNEAYDRMAKSDVKYRFSIDTASLKSE